MDILKASGEKQPFDRDKLCTSMQVAGAPEHVVQKVCGVVEQELKPNTTTAQIEKKTAKLLTKESLLVGARYQLRSAIMELGPSGFFFEDYIAAILREYGYKTTVGSLVQGRCLSHEIDIVAEKDGAKHFMELKYHNRRGLKTDSRVAMYTYARFLDLTSGSAKSKIGKNTGWVVTNTRFTSSAIKYGQCMGLELLGWNYPKKRSLRWFIEESALYPITVLPSATRFIKERFAEHKLLFVHDMLSHSPEDLSRRMGIPQKTAERLIREAYSLV